jgi:excinuclease UvrABC nuclease subunit
MTRRLTSKFETAANVLEQIGAVESIKEKQEIEEKFTD